MHICYLEKKKSAILGKIRNKASLYTYMYIYFYRIFNEKFRIPSSRNSSTLRAVYLKKHLDFIVKKLNCQHCICTGIKRNIARIETRIVWWVHWFYEMYPLSVYALRHVANCCLFLDRLTDNWHCVLPVTVRYYMVIV